MNILGAEWVKLRTVLATAGCLAAVAIALVAAALLVASGSPGTYAERDYVDEFHFVHRPLSGDGTIEARVRDLDAAGPWAMAGVIIKQDTAPGAPYVALPVTAGHGVHLLSNFTVDVAGGDRADFVRLVRSGETITGQVSTDGLMWTVIGTVTLAGLPATVEAGVFVTSPGMTRIHPMRPAMARVRPSTATFEAVRLSPSTDTPWRASDVGRAGGLSTVAGDRFVLTGSGDIIGRTDDGSRIVAATAGTVFATLPAIALGALTMTSEYRFGSLRLTLLANPRRGRVLAAKAVVVAAVMFLTALSATVAALLVTQPLLRSNGFRPPVYPDPALFDATTSRVVAGTAGFLTLLALVSLGAGALLRRTAAAISAVAAAVFVPVVVTPFLPAAAAMWVQRVSPLAGMSAQQVRETDDTLLLPWVGRPWVGVAVLAGYAAVALAAGHLRLRRS